jgi:hypothetical protein
MRVSETRGSGRSRGFRIHAEARRPCGMTSAI